MIWAKVCMSHTFPATVNLFPSSVFSFSQHLSPSLTTALYCHCWNKIYRVVWNFLQMLTKRNKPTGLKGPYGIKNILILYAIYYIRHMYLDTSCFNFFSFPCLDRNKYQPMAQTTFITSWIRNLLSEKNILIYQKQDIIFSVPTF